MPEYPVFEVQLLIEAIAHKSGVTTFDKEGFITLSKQLASKESPYGVDITSRYLKEQVYDQLQKALREEKTMMSFNQSYIDTLSDYIHFKSFNSFHTAIETIKNALTKISPKRGKAYEVAVIHDKADLTNLEEIRRILDQSDCKTLWLNTDMGEAIQQKLREVSLAIVILSNKLTISATKKFLPETAPDASAPFFLFDLTNNNQAIHPTLPPEWQEKPVFDRFNLPLVLSLLKAIIESRLPPQTADSGDTSKGFTSEDAGTIILGNARIKGKYISGRDMNINIHKNKKD